MFDSETMVLGALLGDPRSFPEIRGAVSLDDFATETGKAVFRAACSLVDDGTRLDPVLIRSRAAEQGNELDSQMLINMMAVSAVGDLHIHLQGMKDAVMRSRLLEAVSGAYLRLGSAEPPQGIYTDLQAELQAAVDRNDAHRLITSEAAMLEYVDHRAEVEAGKKRAFVPTGYNSLDNALGGGMVSSGLYILAARPGCGKTTLGLQIAEKVAATGIKTLFISLEMDTIQLTARRLAVETGIPSRRIMLHRLEDAEHGRIAAAMDKLHSHPLFFNKATRATVGSIGVQARQIKGCGLVLVDYLGLLQYEQGRTLYEQVTKTSNALKQLARSLGIPILCLAQLNREMEGRKGPPRLSDLRDSGAIEQDADGVLLLHRPEIVDNTGPALLTCTVAKNRHGPMGAEVELNWYLANGRLVPVYHEPLRDAL